LTENIIRTVKIKDSFEECKDTKTFAFNMKEKNNSYKAPKPGQFAMIWVPGVDEIPMSISNCDTKGNWNITVKDIGECTNAIFNLDQGDFIGVRGPFGNGFEILKENPKYNFIIGGGIGMAPLMYLAQELLNYKKSFILIQGAKTRDEIVYTTQLQKINRKSCDIFFCTEDGSFGSEGIVTESFEIILKTYTKRLLSNATVYTCGPEKMIYSIFEMCEEWNLELQASLERIMRCGCGLCGLCAIDPLGLLVCKDGPVFKSESLRKMGDFGKYKRDFSGRKINL
jgi:dihydroorotate dehydrogenase electron transfer subunit